jgi:arylsulfatase A-like enzyme
MSYGRASKSGRRPLPSLASGRGIGAARCLLVLTLTGSALLPACGTAGSDRPSGPCRSTVRFVDEAAATRGSTHRSRGHVTIAGDTRPVLSASSSVSLLRQSEPTTHSDTTQAYRVTLPRELRAAHSVFVEAIVHSAGHSDRQSALIVRPATDGPVVELVVHLPTIPARKNAVVQVNAYGVADLTTSDVVTAPVTVPPRAVLRFAVGVEEVAWLTGASALEFTIAVVSNQTENVVFRRRVDPAHEETHRQWLDGRIDVSHLAGQTVRWRFRARSIDSKGGAASLPVWADPVLFDASAGAAYPNVVLISLDTLRARSVSTYGCDRATTPALDSLMAEQGTVFEHAITPAPNTLPSHMSLFSGLYPRTHGVRGLGSSLRSTYATLPEALRAAGYATAAFTEDGFLVARAGFQRGFGVYYENTSPDVARPLGQIGDTFGRGRVWLDAHRDQLFFLFLHTYQVHFPYVPPDAYRHSFGHDDAQPSASERARLLYEQEVRYTDDNVQDLLEHLDELGLGERTLVIVTSDHGEEFFEHGQRGHNFHLYDESIRVPLLMRWPGVIPAGLRVTAPVSLVNVAPTILDLLDLPPLGHAEGHSLLPLLRNADRAFKQQVVFAATASSLKSGVDLFAARTATNKCILHSSQENYECYDLATDPEEQQPLGLRDLGDEGTRLRLAIEQFWPWTAESQPEEPERFAPDPATEEKLRALGYLD